MATVSNLPTHLDLPFKDDRIPTNLIEFPQSVLLTDSVTPHLDRLHPDGRYITGHDNFIYWLNTTPYLDGCKAPDWFYVPGVDPVPSDSEFRRSYVLWQEKAVPLLLIEYPSDDGEQERDRTPKSGKFWVYENGIKAPYYAIYFPRTGDIELYHLVGGAYQLVPPNDRGHYPIPEMALELGTVHGRYLHITLNWLRFFDADGKLLLTNRERLELERERTDEERFRADLEHNRAERLQRAADLERDRAEQEGKRAEQESKRAEQESKRAEQERDRAENQQQRADLLEAERTRLLDKLRQLGIDPGQLSS